MEPRWNLVFRIVYSVEATSGFIVVLFPAEAVRGASSGF
jgi:hypothetical protein